VLRLLAEEDRVAGLPRGGRPRAVYHRDWCAPRCSRPRWRAGPASEQRRRHAQLVAMCDVYMWKLLRRDAGLSRAQTELAITELLLPIVEGS
jgi:hypothetical protein